MLNLQQQIVWRHDALGSVPEWFEQHFDRDQFARHDAVVQGHEIDP